MQEMCSGMILHRLLAMVGKSAFELLFCTCTRQVLVFLELPFEIFFINLHPLLLRKFLCKLKRESVCCEENKWILSLLELLESGLKSVLELFYLFTYHILSNVRIESVIALICPMPHHYSCNT